MPQTPQHLQALNVKQWLKKSRLEKQIFKGNIMYHEN